MNALRKLYRGLRAGVAAVAVAALSATATSLPLGAADAAFSLPAPPDAELSPLGDRLRINGQDAHLHELRYPGSTDALLAFYRQRFGGTASEPRGAPGERIVGGLVGNTYVTVQIADDPDRAPDAPIHARLLQMQLQPRSAANVRPAAPAMPVESRLLSDVESQDGNRIARLRVYRNRHSPEANLAFVRSLFASRGLVPVEQDADDGAMQTLQWFADDRGGEALVTVRNAGDQRWVAVHTVARLPVFEPQR